MSQIRTLNAKGIQTEILQNGIELQQKWEEVFAGNLSKGQKQKILFKICMWHIFSYEKMKHISGQAAEGAFNQLKKGKCFLFFHDAEETIFMENANSVKAKDLHVHGQTELYMVDGNFSWTFVLTHEADLGPYFCKPDNVGGE
ncbi:hypothetical protein B0X71_09460 [Planococcus lenghuensis]|uniref:DUF4275 family protein n=2 Tax=Planococcus lenghuensis TaxID=2213202 RepID=A0A1Q2L3P3_9BACL|nr:hypothetical protein B0X71_09460 [Planococcus lenghuensis]